VRTPAGRQDEAARVLSALSNAEALWGAREEYAVNARAVLARGTRMAFLDARAAPAALPRVERLMAQGLFA